jgi:hypothetical protein
MSKRRRRVAVMPVHIVLRSAGELQIEFAEDVGEGCEKLCVGKTNAKGVS